MVHFKKVTDLFYTDLEEFNKNVLPGMVLSSDSIELSGITHISEDNDILGFDLKIIEDGSKELNYIMISPIENFNEHELIELRALDTYEGEIYG